MKIDDLKEKLCYKRESGYKKIQNEAEVTAFCEDYKNFLNIAKTERDSVDYAVSLAEKYGF